MIDAAQNVVGPDEGRPAHRLTGSQVTRSQDTRRPVRHSQLNGSTAQPWTPSSSASTSPPGQEALDCGAQFLGLPLDELIVAFLLRRQGRAGEPVEGCQNHLDGAQTVADGHR